MTYDVGCPDIPQISEGGGEYNRCAFLTGTTQHSRHRTVLQRRFSAQATRLSNDKMMSPLAVMSVLLVCAMAGVTAQRSPYAGASEPGVLPQYLSENELADRLGGGGPNDGTPPPKLHEGTLESEALYNRVQSWPDDKKPFWFLNSVALQAQREQQQQQAQVQTANRRPPFASPATLRGSRSN